MKKYIVLILIALFFSSCMRHEYLVESDYSYGGTFKKYKTFDFMTEVGNDKDSVNHRLAIQEAIQKRMEIQGYNYDTDKPDLIVSYKMFYGNFDFNGYNQPDFEQWVELNIEEEENDNDYSPIRYEMYKGTILVLMWDSRKRRVVWQGYATSMFNDPNQSDRYIKWAVRSIFDQYRIFGSQMAKADIR